MRLSIRKITNTCRPYMHYNNYYISPCFQASCFTLLLLFKFEIYKHIFEFLTPPMSKPYSQSQLPRPDKGWRFKKTGTMPKFSVEVSDVISRSYFLLFFPFVFLIISFFFLAVQVNDTYFGFHTIKCIVNLWYQLRQIFGFSEWSTWIRRFVVPFQSWNKLHL